MMNLRSTSENVSLHVSLVSFEKYYYLSFLCGELIPYDGNVVASGVVTGSCGVTALYHCFLDKITVIPLLSVGNYSSASVTEKVKRYLTHKVLPLPHCKF